MPAACAHALRAVRGSSEAFYWLLLYWCCGHSDLDLNESVAWNFTVTNTQVIIVFNAD
jgi:hypothetical protein